MSLAKKVKSLIKGEKPTFGTNPLDPWSTKAGISESEAGMLSRYLNSRGINPQFVSKDTKISHAKSAEFAKWKNDHQFDDPKDTLNTVMADNLRRQKKGLKEAVDKKDTVTVDIPLLIRILELAREDIKTDMDLHRVVEKLINIRNKGVLTMKDYNYVAKIRESYQLDSLLEVYKDPTALDHETVKRHLHNIMGIPHDENEPTATPAVHRAIKKVSTAGSSSTKTRSKEILRALVQKHHIPVDAEHRALLNKEETELEEGAFKTIATDREETARLKKMTALDRFRADAAAREKKHAKISKNSGGMTSAIDRLEKHLNKEDVYQDSQAATQTVFDGANNPDDCTCHKKKEMSKSARIIKNLYKRKGMKESADGQSGGGIMYDQEKTNKSEVTYGKKPKTLKQEVQQSFGDNKPQAAAVLSGGKTLTGQTRDTLEIDPMMRKPSTPDGKKLDK